MKFEPKIIKNFLNESEILFLKNYVLIQHRNNNEYKNKFDNKGVVTSVDTQFYSDPTFESLSLSKINFLEQELNFKLIPTYTFWRMYTLGSFLKKHKDRESCEISVTVKIGSCKNDWPIFIGEKHYDLKQGEALAYPGMDLFHWRDDFKGDWNAQAFFHYVDANGKFTDYKFDKRSYPGEYKK
jgi:hypothetical protein